ncbi:MAG TPA: hypothetical protein VGR35_08750 [Tepidisphaeraceae bacterium]|nr:hypothetical protein [Tepidisphaeraceae bacterium]
MVKIILLILGLVVGFGGGVYWAHKNPEQAAKISAEEERRFLEAQLAITEKIQAKLDELTGATSDRPKASGFLSSSQSGALAADDVKDIKADAQRQEDALRKRLEQVK